MKLIPEKQKHFAMTLLLVLAALIAVWYFLVQGLSVKQHHDTEEVSRLRDKIASQEKAIQTEKVNREQARAYQAFIAEREEQMPRKNENVETWFVKVISDLAGRQKLQITNTTLQSVKDLSDFKFRNQPYRLEGFQFQFRGEFSQIGRFLQELENTMPLAEVDDLTVTAGGGGEKYIHAVTLRITMVVIKT